MLEVKKVSKDDVVVIRLEKNTKKILKTLASASDKTLSGFILGKVFRNLTTKERAVLQYALKEDIRLIMKYIEGEED